MSCKVKVTTYDKQEAIVVPKDAVHSDEEDENVKYVWIVDPDDHQAPPQRRDVELGRRNGDNVEVVEGLAAGDVISLEDEEEQQENDK